MRVLCVAEKPAISRAVAGHLSGGSHSTHNTRSQYIRNHSFSFDFEQPWGRCDVTMTSVLGHLTNLDFPSDYRSWSHPPPESLFSAPVVTQIYEDKAAIAQNIQSQARACRLLIIWTDCDLEGEHIGQEIVDAARKGNKEIQVKRARFSNVERAHVLAAASRLDNLDAKQVDAVSARIELDLRIGCAFTRLITNGLKNLGGPVEKLTLSYGSCQFPTLGFVVDRYFRVKNFVSEEFWSIKVTVKRDAKVAHFTWARHRLFDRATTIILYERCLAAEQAKITKVQQKPTRKFKPLPLTTVELHKAATRLLRMTGHEAMNIAEGLYNKGFISYPRTETDRFDKGIDLRALVRGQTQDQRWGPFAQGLVDEAFQQPREGKHDDKAHPPIHPITYASTTVLTHDEGRVYEYVVRRFLACCSDDAKGMATEVELQYGDECFSTGGVVVLERNYLEVYVYDKWENSAELPCFVVGEKFAPTEAIMTEGKTSPPSYLTEADLIALMDANGIGTDATMAEHIKKIKDREYVATVEQGTGIATDGEGDGDSEARGTVRGRGSRGRGAGRGGRGRGGAAAPNGGRPGVQSIFIPTQLGVALVLGFDRMRLETSLSKPFLRKEMEQKMKAICRGDSTKTAVLRESIAQYRQVFLQSQEKLGVLHSACREFVFGQVAAATAAAAAGAG